MYGVDINNDDITNIMESFVWEPSLIKRNAIASATDAATIILSIDENIKNPESEQEQHQQMKQPGAGGAGMSPLMSGLMDTKGCIVKL